MIMRPDKQVHQRRKWKRLLVSLGRKHSGGRSVLCGRKEASRSDTGKWNMKSAIDESGIGSNSA